jgi:hypothetical protein
MYCKKNGVFISTFFVVFFLGLNVIFAGNNIKYDSNYIKTYPGVMIARTFLSNKSASLYYDIVDLEKDLTFKPNSKLSFGLGATYKWATVNVGYGFPFLNEENGRGKTKSFDLQTHIYLRNWVIDGFFQSYSGMYLENSTDYYPESDDFFVLRPDLSLFIVGLSGNYLFNGKKFSMRSAITQVERQTKSSGSWIVGLETSLASSSSDSSIISNIPFNTEPLYLDSIIASSLFKIGPSVGYGYNFVVFKNFFLFSSLTLNFAINSSSQELINGEVRNETGLGLGSFIRIAFGYHTDRWYIGLSTLTSTFANSINDNSISTSFSSSKFFLTASRRLEVGKKFKKSIEFIPGF